MFLKNILAKKQGKTSCMLLAAAFTLALSITGMASAQDYGEDVESVLDSGAYEKYVVSGIMNQAEGGFLALRTEPAYDDANIIAELHNGDDIYVSEDRDGDYVTAYDPSSRQTGYVNSNFVKPAGDEDGESGISSSIPQSSFQPVNKVFIGDSRTVDMMNAVQDDSIWSCEVSMGYQWMASSGVPAVESYIGNGTAVIILLGVNDIYNISNYIAYTNQKAAEWAAKGAKTYFAAVGPVESDPYVTNDEIESFNNALQSGLSGVSYIDLYSHLMSSGYSTVDGTHYPDSVSLEIYDYVVSQL